VLVALAILAIALTVLFQVFGSGSRAVATSERYLMATMLARSVMDDIGPETPIVAGEKSGDVGDGYRWTIRSTPSPTMPPVMDGDRILTPYVVQVEISWNGRPVTTLTTLRLVTSKRDPTGRGPG
jgi:general secretion pathway protein I